ncbi:MAG: type I methionyl aminopeptidase [Deltaproteobacteria bacterium RIFOXYD12_FULL_50_9]|nr:MAG: type I methionyl aminopeptidase [Deltaproteobacteria bacterium RIFOXYD12_FULL_50_9]
MGKAIILKTHAEIDILRQANQIVASTLAMLEMNMVPGMTTWELDRMAEQFTLEKGGVPAFKGYRGYPRSLCVSVNEQVVHGIPSHKIKLKDGDIVSIDFGVKYKGYYGDSAITVPIGRVSNEKNELIRVTREALDRGIAQVRTGNRINDISKAVQEYVEQHNFSVVRQFVGHGIGAQLHESPEIPNFSRKERTPKLLPGMVLAIEPMVNAGAYEVEVLSDGWTVVTLDQSPSAHFEHSVVVTDSDPIILSERLH